jgi:hypothetical protein
MEGPPAQKTTSENEGTNGKTAALKLAAGTRVRSLVLK